MPRCFSVVAVVHEPAGTSASTTRLVLSAHVHFMDRDGGNCRVGVRRLAESTGLNKDTVAEHRVKAIEAGWLITSSVSRTSPNRTILASIPDHLAIDPPGQLSGKDGPLLSSAAEQS